MAEESPPVGYSREAEEDVPPSEFREKNKRKFDNDEDEQSLPLPPAPVQAPSSESKPAIYSNVPPPLTDFDLAKQKAAELAAKFSADIEAKRLRTDYYDNSSDHSPAPQSHSSRGEQPGFHSSFQQSYQNYGNQGGGSITKRMDVPNNKVGLVIGKGGETIKYLQQTSGAKIQVTRDTDADPRATTRPVEIIGTSEQISLAEKLLSEVIQDTSYNGGGQSGSSGESVVMKVPNNKVGLIIGRGGETIKALQSKSGAKLNIQSEKDLEPGASERIITLVGPKSATDMAAGYIAEVIDENRPRGPPSFMQGQAGTGAYAGYRGQTSQWSAPSGPPVQSGGYSGAYQQPGAAYPAQQQYQQYPQQTASYQAGGWDQRTGQPAPQAYSGYYAQQPSAAPQAGVAATAATPAASTDNSYPYAQQAYYGYQQAPDASYQQGYGQQAYSQGGYQQPQAAAQYSGYGSYPQQAPGTDPAAAYAQQGYQSYNQSAYPSEASTEAAYDYGNAPPAATAPSSSTPPGQS